MHPAKPVIVTGAPRSGTTWVGRMLAASPELYYIHEPFNPDYRPGLGVCNIKFTRHQTYITESNEHEYYKPIYDMLHGKFNLLAAICENRSLDGIRKAWSQRQIFQDYKRKAMRPLIKDPIALMSAGWLSRRFDVDVVVMIRHPAAFVASMKRLNWGFDPTRWALSQKLLLRDYLSPLEDELKRLRGAGADMVSQIALFWKTAYLVVSKYMKEYPDWIYVKHEVIANDPLPAYKTLYQQLGLSFTADVRENIAAFSNEFNPSRSEGAEKLLKMNSKKVAAQWKKLLSTDEIQRIREIVEEVSDFFYSDKDWL